MKTTNNTYKLNIL